MTAEEIAAANDEVKRLRDQSRSAFKKGDHEKGLSFARQADEAGLKADIFWRGQGQLCLAVALARTVTKAHDQTARQIEARDKALEAVESFRYRPQPDGTDPNAPKLGEVSALAVCVRSWAYLYSKRDASKDNLKGLQLAIKEFDFNPSVEPYIQAALDRRDLANGPFGRNGDAIRDLLGTSAFVRAAQFHSRPRKAELDSAIVLGEAALRVGAAWANRRLQGPRPEDDARDVLVELRKNQVQRLAIRYAWYGDNADFSELLRMSPDVDVLMKEDSKRALDLQKKLMFSYWKHWERAQHRTSLGVARRLASHLANRLLPDDEDKWEAVDMLAGIQRELGELPAAIETQELAVQRYEGSLEDPRHLVRRARLFSDRLLNRGDAPHTAWLEAAWLNGLQSVVEEGFAGKKGETLRRRELAVLLATAFLRSRDRWREAGPIVDRAIGSAKQAQAEAVDFQDRLAAARYYRGLASLAGFAYARAGEYEQAYWAIENSISSVIKAADKTNAQWTPGPPVVPPGHRFGYVGVTPLGAFLLWWDEDHWDGHIAQGLTERELTRVLRDRPDPAEDGPLLSPRLSANQQPSDQIGPQWLAGVRDLADKSGFSSALQAHFAGDRSATIVPLGIMRSVPLHALTVNGAAVFARVPSYSLTAYESARDDAGKKLAEVALANPCSKTREHPKNAYFTESIGDDKASRWEDATRDALISGAARGVVVRVGCHAKFHPETPTASAIELADGDLDVGEILNLNFAGTKVAIMTCCESAVADTRIHSDEGIGLTGAVLHSGAWHVVSGLWKVHSLVATLIDHHVSRLIAEGHTIHGAFAGALSHLHGLAAIGWEAEIDGVRDRILRVALPTSVEARRRRQDSLDALEEIRAKLRTHDPQLQVASRYPHLLAPFILTHLGATPPKDITGT